MRALNYLELAGPLERSGIATAARQQHAALAPTNVTVRTRPWAGDDPLDTAVSVARGDGVFADVDLAHCHLFGPGSVAVARHARRTDTPLVLHAHTLRENTMGSWRGVELLADPLERYLRWFYSLADLVIAPSTYAKDRLETYPIDAPIETLTNGVDLDSLAGVEEFREPYRERFDLDGTVVFTVGNVFERKGLTTFCELAQRTDYEFVWFGPYDTGPHASEAVKRWVNDPPESVTFTGWVDDKRGAFGAGDIFIFPTKSETQGLVALEAMACGKACVLSDLPVFREYFTDGEDCLLCGSEAEYIDAIERLAADPDLRDELGANARETAREHSLDRVGEELAAIYHDLVEAT